MELYPHQQVAVDTLDNGKILWGEVGTGKTLTAFAYFFTKVCGGVIGDPESVRTPRDIIVITTAKVRDGLDWEHVASKFYVGKDRDASLSGMELTVDSWNNIAKYIDRKDSFFIFDEQRVVGYGAWSKAFIKITKHNQWILLTATPGDVWLDYAPVFIANGFYKNITDFKNQHVIYEPFSKFPKIKGYRGTQRLQKQKLDLLVHMPYTRKTTRHHKTIEVEYDKDLYQKVWADRWHVYENRPLSNVSELFSVMRKVVNSDESRLRAVHQLLLDHPRLIVFYNFDYELEQLRKLAKANVKDVSSSLGMTSSGFKSETTSTTQKTSLSSSKINSKSNPNAGTTCGSNTTSIPLSTENTVEVAEWNGHKHEPIPDTERWLYLVQYQAGAEGWNCTSTDAMAFYSLTYSYKNWHQAHGRIDRLNNTFMDLNYYKLKSRAPMDKMVDTALSSKKSFNERGTGVKL